MNTYTATTASSVSRFLKSVGFEKYDRWDEVGFAVMLDGKTIRVVNHTYSTGTAAIELAAKGYVIENFEQNVGAFTGRHMESFVVAGKVAA